MAGSTVSFVNRRGGVVPTLYLRYKYTCVIPALYTHSDVRPIYAYIFITKYRTRSSSNN